MTQEIVLCIVGAGSSYTPELINGLLACSPAELPVREVRLHDVAPERMGIMAGLTERMIARSGRDIRVTAGTVLEPLLEGCGFVVTQIRVGGMRARHLDESIPLKYGLLGQETTGAGGMLKALRTVPVMLEVARTVERVCPDATILNYTNPSGIVAEAVCRHTGARLIGLCSGIPGIQSRLGELLAAEYPDLKMYCVGLNHLGFVHRFMADGEEVTDAVLARLLELAAVFPDHADLVSPDLIRLLRAVPISYVNYYFRRGASLAAQRKADRTRAEVIMELEEKIFAEAVDPAMASKPASLEARGGGGYSAVTLDFMKAIYQDTGAELPCTVLNRGAVEGIPDDAGVEIVCRVGRTGPEPLPVGPLPLAFRGVVQAVKAYESLTVAAAVEGRRELAVQALLNHPLVGDLDVIEPLLDEMLAAHGLTLR